MALLTAEPTTRPRSASLEERSAVPQAPEKDEKKVNEGEKNEASEAPVPNERPDFAMAGNGEAQPELKGNASLAPMEAVPKAEASAGRDEGKEEKEKEEKPEASAPELKLEGASTGGDEGTEGGEEGQGPPAAGDGAGGMAGEGESKPEAKKKEGAEGEKKEGEGEPASHEGAEKEGDDKKKITGKSPKEFQEAGKKDDKEQAVPQNTNPHKDKAFQGAMYQTKKTKDAQGTHLPPEMKVAEEILAGPLSAKEQDKKNAQLGHIGKMDGMAKTKKKTKQPFTPEKFKKVLKKHLKELEKQLPKNESGAKKFKRDKPIDKVGEAISSDVKKENEAITGPMAAEAQQKNPPPSTVKAIEAQPIPDEKVGPQPRPISPGAAVPKKKNDSELSMQKESQSLDDYMAENKVTEESLAKSNEPTFIEALGKKKQAQKAATYAPTEFRAKENSTLKGAKQSSYATSKKGLEGMHGSRKDAFAKVLTGQNKNAKNDQSKQKKIFKDLETIYKKTKKDATKKLDDLSESVDTIFSAQSKIATIIFETNVESRLDDIYGITVIDDWLFGEDTEGIEQAFRIEKTRFIKTINGVLNDLAKLIAKRLNEAITIIENGRKKSDDYFKSLSKEEQKLAKDAYDDFNDQYNSLEESVHDKEKEIAQSLARAYNDNVKSLRAKFDKIKKKVSAGLIGAAFNFIAGIVKAILKIKDLLLNLLSAAISAIGAIISDPIGFLSNLINGIKQGFANFGKNLLSNIMTGLIEWLTGSLEGVRIKMPKDLFSLSGIFSLVTQILGLTWDYFRAMAVKLVGEPLAKLMETGMEVFKIIRSKGVEGLWEYIKDQFSNLKEMVMDAIRDMIITKVIEAGIKWILGLMSPAGAFIKAAMMIIDIVRFFIERASQIFELVQAFIDGIRALANGNVASVAKAIERALVKAIPVLIGFLAALVGITGLTGKIQKIIKRVRGKIDRAITKIIKKARKAFKGLVKKGKKKVKGVIKGLVQWWKARKKFKGKDGKMHKLYFKGSDKKATLMVASAPKNYFDFVRRIQIPKENKEGLNIKINAKAKAMEVDKEASRKLRGANEKQKQADSKKKKARVDTLLSQLAPMTAILMGIQEGELPDSIIVYGGQTDQGFSKRVEGKILSRKGKPGSQPQESNSAYKTLFMRKLGSGIYYVRGHMINEHIHGPGKLKNLTPLSVQGNKNHLKAAEDPVKIAVKAGAVVRYTVSAKYNRSTISSNINDEEFEKAGIPEEERENVKKIRVMENHVPSGLVLGADIQKKSKSGKWIKDKTLVSGRGVLNPVDTNLSSYRTTKGAIKKTVGIKTSSIEDLVNVSKINRSYLEVIQSAARRISSRINRYSQIEKELPNVSSYVEADKKSYLRALNKLQSMPSSQIKLN